MNGYGPSRRPGGAGPDDPLSGQPDGGVRWGGRELLRRGGQGPRQALVGAGGRARAGTVLAVPPPQNAPVEKDGVKVGGGDPGKAGWVASRCGGVNGYRVDAVQRRHLV